jgi:hypothetical protein
MIRMFRNFLFPRCLPWACLLGLSEFNDGHVQVDGGILFIFEV